MHRQNRYNVMVIAILISQNENIVKQEMKKGKRNSFTNWHLATGYILVVLISMEYIAVVKPI